MVGFGEATAHGAATIINAIATGKGSAIGVDLWTKARVRLTDDAGVISGIIANEPTEDTALMKESVLGVLRYFGRDKKHGADIETESNIPIARGLKSSSVAANAIALATSAALGTRLNNLTAVVLGVDAAIRAKTTITGAFDDASASFFGGIVVTDNLKRVILKRFKVSDNLAVLFHVPDEKSYTYTSDVDTMRLMAPQVEVAFKEVKAGNYWTALTLNGMIYSSALGYDAKIAIDAIKAGAIASGLSGKGPATSAIAIEEDVGRISDAWRPYGGKVVKAKVNSIKACVTRRE
jgi:shikimate kinase